MPECWPAWPHELQHHPTPASHLLPCAWPWPDFKKILMVPFALVVHCHRPRCLRAIPFGLALSVFTLGSHGLDGLSVGGPAGGLRCSAGYGRCA